jgi:hypothetical protein
VTINGLAALDSDQAQKRQQRARPVPPSAKGRLTITQGPVENPPASAVDVANVQESAETSHVASQDEPHKAQRSLSAEDDPTDQPPDDGPLRAAQVYLDGTTDDHLRRIRAEALVGGGDVTNSAVVRRSVAEFVERHGYDGIVELLSEDPRIKRGRGRPRR